MHETRPPLDRSAAGQPEGGKRSSRLTLWMVVTVLACAALFTVFPQIDLAVSGAFYDPLHGFSGDHNPFVQSLYRGIPLMSRATVIGLFIALFAYSFQRGATGRKRRIQVAYLIAALLLGPGLLVDVALKDYWGRARPVKVAEFGGTKTFTPAMRPSDQCDSNCSFVSGHASAGFYLVSLGFLGGAAARRRWTLIGLAVGAIFGMGRIAQGGHFLSDVVFSFYVTWFAAWAAWALFRRLRWLQGETEAGA
ncbi:phosphatase PAP2 family protein [Aromatoleum toluvorans]|uniref:Phosphatase PAP2 family protein n=1 Tax=Aromatoleum toluvorans TaxID=92002 RepID=A0ABX1PVR0_9RHOO|nr:phosphatase PAP2 family protein [Aromatoleum toluvorans]NMG42787.1 phosphatase PAP2 family protein [Aromatoleum toluvorans]